MKHLVKFSLSRRFKNKVTIIMHILIIAIAFLGVFMDKVVEFVFSESPNKQVIYYEQDLEEVFNIESDHFDYKAGYHDKEINIFYEDAWIIESEHTLDTLTSNLLQTEIVNSISSNWLEGLNDQSINEVLTNISPEIIERTRSENVISQDKLNMSMFLITGIYFAMISFSTMIANEVVYEKTSKVLELILTSISCEIHYFSKMIVAWLTVMIQIISTIMEVSFVVILRNYYDEGAGLMKILNKYHLVENSPLTFNDFIVNLGIDKNLVIILVTSIIFMLLGIVIVQMIMVCISSYINSIEESGTIQAPVYIVFLLIYYLALALNSPVKLSGGLGYYLSLTPIVSMLFMPMRLLLVKVSIYEIILGIVLNIITLVIFSYYGSKIYKHGILGGYIFRKKKSKE